MTTLLPDTHRRQPRVEIGSSRREFTVRPGAMALLKLDEPFSPPTAAITSVLSV